MDLAVQIEGMIRGLGKHAGGVVIAPGPLEDYVPFYTEHSDGVAIAQLDKDDLEAVGLVKFDFLGLKTLTVMDWALAAINESRSPDEHVHLDTLPLDDTTTFDLIQNAHTDGVFQLESEGMRNTIRRLQPDRLEDLGVLNALYRPGPMANNAIESYGDRKKGIQEVIYPHPLLEPVLDKTYGEMVYQEDVMNVSRALAGFTLGKADLLRRAMGKKDSAKMQETKAEFISGAKEKGVSEQIANEVFHRIEVFAEYAFPRAHAMSYALVAYQTAYLKANFFSEYMAAYMSTEFDSSDANKMASLFRELDRVNVRILPPSVNKSGVLFTTEQGKIRFGLATIKGIGEDLARGIVEERKNGDYKDVADFCSRVSLEKVNESVVEKMIQCGALDELYPQSCDVCLGRAWLIESCNLGLRSEKEKVKQKANGVVGLFGEDQATPTLDLKSVVPLSWEELASTENKLLSFTFTVSLSDHFSEECRHISDYPLSDLKPTNGRTRTRIAGKVVKVNRVVTNNGNVMLRSTLQDGAANCDVAFFDNVDETESRLNELDYAVVECQVSNGNNGRLRVNGRKLLSLEEARDKWGKQLNVRFNGDSCDKFSAVADLLQQH
ncbi:MAG: DNA polymerase III subunit alpha, partial [Gammaproteobacteria bacterium]|nr:DNA polymerase III subunit alpha [Gammaproteobacteria bacterium]